MSFENPPRPKKVETAQPLVFTDPEPEMLKPLEAESPAIETETAEKPKVFSSMADFNANMREHGEYDYESAFKKDAAEAIERFGSSTTPESRAEHKARLKEMLEEYTEILGSKSPRAGVTAEQPQPEETTSAAKPPAKKWIKGLYFEDKELETQIKPETVSPQSISRNRTVLNLSSTFGEAENKQPEIANNTEKEKEQSGTPEMPKKPENPGEEIKPAGAAESLAPSVSKFMELADKVGVGKKRSAMRAAEAEYLSKYKEFHKKGGLSLRTTEKQNLKKLEDAYNKSRVEYARSLASAGTAENIAPSPAFKARMEARYAKMISEGETPKDYFNNPVTVEKYVELENQKRNESLAKYARYREVIKPAAEKKIEARKEVLDAKGQNAFQKGLAWVGEKNQALEKQFGKNGAKGIRILASTVLVGGVAAAAGSFGTASLISIAGWGTFKAGKALVGSIVGGYAGEIGATAYENFRGKGEQEKAKKNLKGLGKNSEVSLASLKELDKERGKLIGRADERTLETKKNLVKAFIAFGFGAGTSAALADLNSVHAATELSWGKGFEHLPSHEPSHEHVPGAQHESVVKAPEKPAVSHERFEHQPHAAAGQEVPPAKPEAPVPAAGSETMAIDEKIYDSDRLIGHFAEKLQHDYTGVHPDHVPPAVKTYQGLFETKPGARLELGENHAADELGLRAHGLSEIMHKGDTISLNKDNQIVINWAEHGRPPSVLINSDGSVHEFNDMLSGPGRMSTEHLAHQVSPHTESHAAPETAAHSPTHAASHAPQSAPAHEATSATQAHTDTAPAAGTPDDGLSQSQRDAYALELKNNGVLPHTETTPTPHPEPVAPTHTEAQSLESTPVHTPEISTNHFGVKVDPGAPHLYEMVDAETKEKSLAFYGVDKQHDVFFQKLEEMAKANPGKTIYFDNPEPTTVTGSEQPWINSVTYTSDSGMAIPVFPSDPNFIGAKLNTDQFATLLK